MSHARMFHSRHVASSLKRMWHLACEDGHVKASPALGEVPQTFTFAWCLGLYQWEFFVAPMPTVTQDFGF